MSTDDSNIRARIQKDIDLFYVNVAPIKSEDKAVIRVIELSKMYASDSKSFLAKDDLYTAFASINYAHGLLDAVREMVK
jgi:uncharacterized protein